MFMASTTNKRQQARNERTLQELLRNVPGNDVCADCQARNPGWASYNIGVFLCVRCAAFHRSLGTHISKVKSISMDLWNSEQVEAMKRGGNVASNRLYNPRNVRPVVPFDPDMVDSAMERYIKQKYQHRAFSADKPSTRQNTGSTVSTDDFPPPPPPKPLPKFAPNLRSSSATFPLSQREKDLPPPTVSNGSRRGLVHSPISSGRISFEGAGNETFNDKLATLKEKGFRNEKKNAAILKGHDGNLEKTVESLIRLGEGVSIHSQSQAGGRSQTLPTPLNHPAPATSQPHVENTPTWNFVDNNVQGSAMSNLNPYNPFLGQTSSQVPQQAALELSMQSMQISPQPLFPHSTGSWAQASQTNPFLKGFTPPMSPAPQQYNGIANQGASYGHELQQQAPSHANNSNPFHRIAQQQGISSSPVMFGNAQYSSVTTSPNPEFYGQVMSPNPFFNIDPAMHGAAGPQFSQSQYTPATTHLYGGPQSQSSYAPSETHPVQYSAPMGDSFNPWQNPATYSPNSYESYQQQPQVNMRMDKGSILALYNQTPTTSALSNTPATGTDIHFSAQQDVFGPGPRHLQRSVTMPASLSTTMQSNNPFSSLASSQTQGDTNGTADSTKTAGTSNTKHVRQESKEFSGSSMTNGRHSPDAFANLSARFV